MADFTGFYLDGIHSSTYGILRVSNGKRYSETLIPEFEDYELELAGGDGSFYGGSNFKKTPFEIKIAFDKLTEQQFRQLRHWLGKKELQPFRFDERPYKTYWVKLESAPKFDYVCFMEQSENGFIGDKERIYKGEGDLKFIAYDPFGYCIDNSTKMTENGLEEVDDINWQVLDSYTPFEIVDENISEWGITSGLKRTEQLKDYNKFERQEHGESWSYNAKLYNPGDFDTDFELYLSSEKESEPEATDESLLTFLKKEDGTYAITGYKTDAPQKIYVFPSKYQGVSVTEIDAHAFHACETVEEIIIPEGILNLSKYCFAECYNLKKVTISNSVKTIEECAFFSCEKLEEINIGTELIKIEEGAFIFCFSLKSFYCYAKKSPILSQGRVFDAAIKNCNLYVPEETLNEYQKVEEWSKFNIIPLTKPLVTLQIESENQELHSFQFSLISFETNKGLLLSTKKHSLVVYHTDGQKSMRYDLIKSTHWPKVPMGESTIKIFCNFSGLIPQIKYNYKYY